MEHLEINHSEYKWKFNTGTIRKSVLAGGV